LVVNYVVGGTPGNAMRINIAVTAGQIARTVHAKSCETWNTMPFSEGC
jgi:hypothetical protein